MQYRLFASKLIASSFIVFLAYYMTFPLYEIGKQAFKMQYYLESVNGNNFSLQYFYLQLKSIAPLYPNFWVSVRISLFCALTSALFCSMVAYGLVMYRFKARHIIFSLLLLMLLIPEALKIIPFYLVLKQLGLIGSETTLWISFTVPALSVFIIRQYIITVIRPDTIEAGRLEGASEWHIFRRLVLPLLLPALIVVLVIQFAFMWNQFTLALYTLGGEESKYPVALMARKEMLPPIVYAISTFFPLLILLLGSKYIIRFVDSAF